MALTWDVSELIPSTMLMADNTLCIFTSIDCRVFASLRRKNGIKERIAAADQRALERAIRSSLQCGQLRRVLLWL